MADRLRRVGIVDPHRIRVDAEVDRLVPGRPHGGEHRVPETDLRWSTPSATFTSHEALYRVRDGVDGQPELLATRGPGAEALKRSTPIRTPSSRPIAPSRR